MSATVPTPGTSRQRRLALLVATTGLAAGGAMVPASAFAASPPAHATSQAAFHGPHGHGVTTTSTTTTTETTTKNRHSTTTTKSTETTTTKSRHGTTTTTTTQTTTTEGRHKFHPHDQNITSNSPLNSQ
ncbi:hypothetical protein ACFZCP_45690 [Streptomyces sp. NPDC007971]|uniref:hypothetical protein n=1 Tax=Streptomyces sp. NPDC007971 TaxID=3364799 RepID=UPI0036EBE4AF